MKISRITAAMFFIFIAAIGFTYAQENSKKDKSKDKKAAAKPIEIKANLLVINSNGKLADDVKQEDVKIYEDGVEQKIESFVKKQNAFNVALVMDNTGSMRSQLSNVVAAGINFVANIRPQDEVLVIRFVNSQKVEVFQDWTANQTLLKDALTNLYIEGGQSAVIDALYLAVEESVKREKNDKTVRSVLILVSDGDDRNSYFTKDQLFELLKESDTQIFTLGLPGQPANDKGELAAKNFINQLALETGGAAFFVGGKKDELVAALKGILTELNSQYVVGYTSTNQKRDGISRKLTVQIADGANGAKRQPTLRGNFTVPKEK